MPNDINKTLYKLRNARPLSSDELSHVQRLASQRDKHLTKADRRKVANLSANPLTRHSGGKQFTREEVTELLLAFQAQILVTRIDYLESIANPFDVEDALIPTDGLQVNPRQWGTLSTRNGFAVNFNKDLNAFVETNVDYRFQGTYAAATSRRNIFIWFPTAKRIRDANMNGTTWTAAGEDIALHNTDAAHALDPDSEQILAEYSFGPATVNTGWNSIKPDEDTVDLLYGTDGDDLIATQWGLVSAGLRVSVGVGSDVGGFVKVYHHPDLIVAESTTYDTVGEYSAILTNDSYLEKTYSIQEVAKDGLTMIYQPQGPVDNPLAPDRLVDLHVSAIADHRPTRQAFVLEFIPDGTNEVPCYFESAANLEYIPVPHLSTWHATTAKPSTSEGEPYERSGRRLSVIGDIGKAGNTIARVGRNIRRQWRGNRVAQFAGGVGDTVGTASDLLLDLERLLGLA